MANDAKFTIVVDALVELTKAIKESKNLANATDNVGRSQEKAAKAGKKHNDIVNGGVASANNAGRSMSKLLETVGGENSGLVAAYATLATNAFAVSAAFNALRSASQVELLLKGIETQGAKTGRTLTLASNSLRELTGFALSTADALKATSQMTSAGFGQKELERLGKVATNASIALGRNLPDSMDRIIKGVTKLEPELLDELGIMTKLGDATAAYALANHKSVAGLTAFEKRQAMANAVAAEGELKYSGLAEAVGANPYDKLAASFDNLVTTVLQGLNVIAKPIANLMSMNQGVLFGSLVLFASTISKQMLPAMSKMAEASAKRKEDLLKEAELQKQLAADSLKTAKIQQSAAVTKARAFTVPEKAPAKFKAVADTFKEGTASAKDFNTEINRINSSIRASQAQMDNIYKGTDQEAAKQKILDENKALLASIIALRDAEENASKTVITSTEDSIKAKRKERIARLDAATEASKFSAYESAANFKFAESWGHVKDATESYRESLKRLRTEKVGESTNKVSEGFAKLGGILDKVKVGGFMAATGIRAIGTSIMAALPIIGWVITGISAMIAGWDTLTKTQTDLDKAKALEDFGVVVEDTDKKIEQLAKTQGSLAAYSSVTSQYLIAQANSMTELGNATAEATKTFKDALKQEAEGKGIASLWDVLLTPAQGAEKVQASYQTGIEQGSKLLKPFEDQLKGSFWDNLKNSMSMLTGIDALSPFEKKQVLVAKAFDQTSKIISKDYYNALVKAYGGEDKLVNSEALQESFIKQATAAYDNLAETISGLGEAFKSLELATTAFLTGEVQTTKYDKMLTSVEAVNDAISVLRSSPVMSAADIGGLISGIGPDTERLLNLQNSKLLDQAKIQFQIKQTLEEKKKVEGELSGVNQRDLNTANSTLDAYSEQVPALQANLLTLQDTLSRNQAIERSQKDQIGILQAIMSTNQEAYKAGGVGMKAKLDKEQQIRDLQKQQLETQKAMLETTILGIKLELQSLDIQKEKSAQIIEQQVRSAKMSRDLAEATAKSAGLSDQEIASGKLSPGRPQPKGGPDPLAGAAVGSAPDPQSALQALNIADTTLAQAKKAQEEYNKSLVLKRQIRDTQAAVNSLTAQANQITQAGLTREQKKARIAEAETEFVAERIALEKKNKYTQEDLVDNQKKYNDLLKSAPIGIVQEISDILSSGQDKARDTMDNFTREEAARLAAITRLEADRDAQSRLGNTEEAAALDHAIENAKAINTEKTKEKDLTLQIVDLETKKALAEKTTVNIYSTGLEMQQKGLDVLKASYSEQDKLLSQTQELYRLRAETTAAKTGMPISEKAQKAIEVTVASEQLALVEEQYNLKKAGIDLEYGLLEAQRLFMLENLKAQRAIQGMELARLKSNPAADKDTVATLEKSLGQFDSTIQNLSKKSYDDVKALALAGLDKELEIAKAKKEKAIAERDNFGRVPTLFDKIQQGLDNARLLKESFQAENRKSASADIAAPVISSPAKLIADRQKDLQDAINDNFPKLTAEIAKITGDNTSVIDKSIQTATEAAITSSTAKILTTASGFLKLPTGTTVPGGEFGAPRVYNGKAGKHAGVDIARPEGKGVTTPIAGRVIDTGSTKYGGFFATVENESKNLRYTVRHLKESVSNLEGSLVKSGDVIGKVGQTGRASGPHEHIEVSSLVEGVWKKINPTLMKIVTAQAAAAPAAPKDTVENAFKDYTFPKETYAPTAQAISPDTPAGIKAIMSSGPVQAPSMEGMTAISDITKNAEQGLSNAPLTFAQNFAVAKEAIQPVLDELTKLGPDGELVSAVANGAETMVNAFDTFFKSVKQGGVSIDNAVALASAGISVLSSLNEASSKAKSAAIDKEIAAEEKRDGKSKESLAKIAVLQKKKEAEERKAFENNKKLKMAEVVINTAAAIAAALPNIPKAILAGAMGAAQLAVIASTSYSGYSAPAATVSTPAALSIGKRDDSVDLARGPSANAGGEVGYIRGSSGTGSNASNYRTIGSAYGGELMRGYGNRGFVVGEKGPEVITPETPISVTPANDVQGQSPVNATISIHALDSSDVQRVLVEQKGNIIKMLRQAANASGQTFMEDVNVNVYTRPSVGKL